MTDKLDLSAISSECQHTSYHLPQWDENGKCSWINIQLQRKSLNAEAKCIVPPTKVIPVIFIPGIMGTNLMSKNSDKKEIWRGDSLASVYWEWHSKGGRQRQQSLDPNTTIVDNRGNIEKEILTPFSDDGCLFPSRKNRNWGAALGFSYGRFLNVFQAALLDDWQTELVNYEKKYSYRDPDTFEIQSVTLKYSGTVSKLVGKKFDTHEKESEEPLTSNEFNHFKRFLFPVHVFGYNWLQDNKISAESLKTYIDDVLKLYREQHGYGLAQEKVILVTHSMGGLIARYTSQVLGMKEKILGIIHGVIPDLGSPAAYRRMKVGAEGEGFLGTAGHVLGSTAEELMPVLAQAPSALQLLPSPKYRSPWLTITRFSIDNDVFYPKNHDPFSEIYLQKDAWWRLYESDIIDKDKVTSESNWFRYNLLMKNQVKSFITELATCEYHPNTYVFYGNKEKSDGKLIWNQVVSTANYSPHIGIRPPPTKHRRVLESGYPLQEFQLTSSETPGDGTVPIESFDAIKSSCSIKSILATNVEHQSAYEVASLSNISDKPAIKFTLRAIAKMVKDIPSSESQ
ncbi:lipase family alpha/beta hydrolase [Providencia vermicola]